MQVKKYVYIHSQVTRSERAREREQEMRTERRTESENQRCSGEACWWCLQLPTATAGYVSAGRREASSWLFLVQILLFCIDRNNVVRKTWCMSYQTNPCHIRGFIKPPFLYSFFCVAFVATDQPVGVDIAGCTHSVAPYVVMAAVAAKPPSGATSHEEASPRKNTTSLTHQQRTFDILWQIIYIHVESTISGAAQLCSLSVTQERCGNCRKKD